jgi:preprotein translocase subunit SecY
MYGGQSTYIPLKVNQAGVIPIIFASAVLYLPVLLSQVLPADGWGKSVRTSSTTCVPATHPCTWCFYGLLIIGFAYFYTAIAVRPGATGRQPAQAGRLHPRHPPGPQTERYLAKILSRITLPGPVHRRPRASCRRSSSAIVD